jgi:quaternary ammonium compound-resistance protein SugE
LAENGNQPSASGDFAQIGKRNNMAWIYLLAGGIFEVCATTALRYATNWTAYRAIAALLVFGTLSLICLQKSLAGIPLGTAYAVWTGIGAAGTALLGFAYFNEPASTLRLVFLTLLIGSILGLKLVSE